MLYALHFTVRPGSETARRLQTNQNLAYHSDTEISCELRPVREAGIEPAVSGFIENPDIDKLTITRLRNYREPDDG